MNTSDLSVIIITRNEEHDIQDCLDSIKDIASEIIVVDSGSTDRTIEICKTVTPHVFSNDWPGYSAQKQFALNKAKGPWVLNIDADERVSPSLRKEIKEAVSNDSSVQGYRIPFRHYFLGRCLRFGGNWGETHVRLFKKESARYGTDPIHEGIQVKGDLASLNGWVDHYSYRTIKDYLGKCNEYTSLIAEKKFKQGKRFHFWHHLRLPYEFVVRFVVKLGFLDGPIGLVYAVLSSYYVWLKFAKLKDLEMKKI